jgi:hypothetical protein
MSAQSFLSVPLFMDHKHHQAMVDNELEYSEQGSYFLPLLSALPSTICTVEEHIISECWHVMALAVDPVLTVKLTKAIINQYHRLSQQSQFMIDDQYPEGTAPITKLLSRLFDTRRFLGTALLTKSITQSTFSLGQRIFTAGYTTTCTHEYANCPHCTNP